MACGSTFPHGMCSPFEMKNRGSAKDTVALSLLGGDIRLSSQNDGAMCDHDKLKGWSAAVLKDVRLLEHAKKVK